VKHVEQLEMNSTR